MAGYSGTPLVKKLGIKAKHRIALVNAPPGFASLLTDIPDDVTVRDELGGGLLDVILFFTDRRGELAKRFHAVARHLDPAGGLWIAWPKKASGVATDVTENIVRDIGLAAGLVDNKICAVDDIWSGLRFVIRLKDRSKKRS